MDAARALADLTEISSQIEAAVLFTEDGGVVGSTLGDEETSATLVRRARELLDAAASLRSEDVAVTQVEASLADGSVFVVRSGADGIVATTAPRPTVGLVFYDLKSCLRSAAESEPEEPKRRRRPAAKKTAEDAPADPPEAPAEGPVAAEGEPDEA